MAKIIDWGQVQNQADNIRSRIIDWKSELPKASSSVNITSKLASPELRKLQGVAKWEKIEPPKKDKPFFSKLVDTLSYPSEKTEEILTGGEGYEKTLASWGIKNEIAQKVGGFAGRLVLDPLNLVSPLKIGSKILSVTGKGVKLATKIKPIKTAVQAAEELFVPLAKVKRVSPQLAQELPALETLTKAKQQQVVTRVAKIAKQFPEEIRNNLGKLVEAAGKGAKLTEEESKAVKTITDFIQKEITKPEVKAGVSPNLIANYFPRKVEREGVENMLKFGGKRLSLSLGGAQKARTFVTQEAGEKAGIIYKDALEALGIRASKSQAVRENAKFISRLISGEIKDIDNNPLIKPVTKFVENGYKEFSIKGLKNFQAPIEVVDELEKYFNTFISDDATNAFLKTYDKALGLWKASVTSIFPAFHIRNAVGNLYNMFLGGFNLKHVHRFKQAADIQRGGSVTIGKTKVTGEMLEQLGLKGTGFMGGDIPETLTRTIGKRTISSTLKELNPFELGRRAGTVVEDNSRIAFFLDRLSKNDDIPKAVSQVKKYLFDYTALTPFEKNVMKRTLPFYCVPDTSLILTRFGWKNVDSLRIGDEVLSYNLRKDALEWDNVLNKAVFDYDQPIRVWRNKRHSITFTHEHRWVVQTKNRNIKKHFYPATTTIRPSTELNSLHYFKVASRYQGKKNGLTKEQASLLGWLLTDGYYRWRKNCCEAVIYQHPKKYLKEVMFIAGGKPRKPHPVTGVICVPVERERLKTLTHLLKRNKQIDDWIDVVTSLSEEALKAMYDSMMKADGHIGKKQTSFACQLDGVAKTFEVLATMLGKRIVKNGRGFYVSDFQTIGIKDGKFTEEPYFGKVWCPKTKNGTWIMKQGKIITITGNTWIRNNLPLQIESLITQPGKPAAFVKLFKNLNPLTEEEYEVLPDYIKEGLVTKVGKGEDNNIKILTSLGLPIEDLGRLYRGGIKRTAEREILAAGGPLANLLGITIDRDFFRGKNISELGYTYGRSAKNYPKWMKDLLEFREEKSKKGDKYYYVNPEKFAVLNALFSRITKTGTELFSEKDVAAPFKFFREQEVNLNEAQEARERDQIKNLEKVLIDKGVIKEFKKTNVPK